MTLVIGESDTGKTTLVRDLANGLLARGLAVGIVDADLGQSEIGPPTTVGLGRVVAPLAHLGDAEVVAIRFVGVTSGAREPLDTVAATRRLVDRARAAGLDRVLVDTCGLVRGDLGRRLKHATIEALDPDLVIALEHEAECDAILHAYRVAARPGVVRLRATAAVRPRNTEVRRRHRERALAAHLEGAHSLALDLSRVRMRDPVLFAGIPFTAAEIAEAERVVGRPLVWGERRGDDVTIVSPGGLDERESRALAQAMRVTGLAHHALRDIEGMLAGLEDGEHETLGLGVVRNLDFTRARLHVDTAIQEDRIASIAIGRERSGIP